ncbi:MAG: threonine synthase [Oscillospiraceae bacterium]|nr:threonine synthase [Oscillospiraceae bacterium]MCR4761780.1 threonine synthase [Oscillospiraceae bacterium]
MIYHSTRNSALTVSSAEAIAQGIAADGGLFVPAFIPELSAADFESLKGLPYAERAARLFKLYLTDFTDEELRECTHNAYESGSFETPDVQEITTLADGSMLLELWHGPTCAFKDMALQILPHFLTRSIRKTGTDKEVVILTATSGDTGKAALAGFKDVPGTRIMVFYPEDGVSSMQKRQMQTQEGANVRVCAVKGNFDDCQNGVKAIFTDPAMQKALDENGMQFSSANSINWGRLVPQIVYYISAYVTLLEKGVLKDGDRFNVTVPTGNFGNILAAWYAKQMGVPIAHLICASNINNVLTDFINTGVYDRSRTFHATVSPSMDILISSNLERLLYHMTGGNDAQIREWFTALKTDGRYEVGTELRNRIQAEFSGSFWDDDATKAMIGKVFSENGYLSDTHTAVGICAARDYNAKAAEQQPMLIASTANPYKFGAAVLSAVGGSADGADEYDVLNLLQEKSGMKIPAALAELKTKAVRFTDSVAQDAMPAYVKEKLGIR